MCWGITGANRGPWAATGVDARSKPSRKINGIPGRHCIAYISQPHVPFLPRVILSTLRSSSRAPLESSFSRASSAWENPNPLLRTNPCSFPCSAYASLFHLAIARFPGLRLTVLFLKVGLQIRQATLSHPGTSQPAITSFI